MLLLVVLEKSVNLHACLFAPTCADVYMQHVREGEHRYLTTHNSSVVMINAYIKTGPCFLPLCQEALRVQIVYVNRKSIGIYSGFGSNLERCQDRHER